MEIRKMALKVYVDKREYDFTMQDGKNLTVILCKYDDYNNPKTIVTCKENGESTFVLNINFSLENPSLNLRYVQAIVRKYIGEIKAFNKESSSVYVLNTKTGRTFTADFERAVPETHISRNYFHDYYRECSAEYCSDVHDEDYPYREYLPDLWDTAALANILISSIEYDKKKYPQFFKEKNLW